MNCYASKTKFYFNPTPKNKIKIEELKLINLGRSNTGNSVVFTNEVLKTSRKCQVNIGISAKISGINDFLQKIFSRVFKSKQALTYLIHCKDHPHLYFLYNVVHIHILSSCQGNHGNLKYQDTSTGKLVSSLKTRLGRCDCMTQNPYNAVIQLGHHNGELSVNYFWNRQDGKIKLIFVVVVQEHGEIQVIYSNRLISVKCLM